MHNPVYRSRSVYIQSATDLELCFTVQSSKCMSLIKKFQGFSNQEQQDNLVRGLAWVLMGTALCQLGGKSSDL
jgi:hypothetical protein